MSNLYDSQDVSFIKFRKGVGEIFWIYILNEFKELSQLSSEYLKYSNHRYLSQYASDEEIYNMCNLARISTSFRCTDFT